MPEPNTEFENKLAASDFGKMVQLPPITIPGSTKAPADMSVDELSASMRGQASLFLDKAANPYTPQLISPLQIDQTGRYNKQLVGWDNEDLYGSMQSNWDKAANGVLKGLELAGTTFLQGTVGLVAGLGNVITGNGMSSFYNNDFSQLMDKWNKEAEIALPNYYTAKETNAEWYSPDNLFTANFIFDKLIKNAGFSLGALAAGGAVSKVLSGTMKAVGLLSEAKQAAQLVTALDEALPAVPQAARAAKFQELLSQAIPKMTAKGVDRTVTSLFGAATEGGIEAMQGLNEFRNQKIAEFQNLNGRIPNDQEMKLINEEASSLGNSRFFMNVGLLSATNYIQLPRILGSRYSTSKAIANTEAAARGEVGGIRRTAEGAFERALPTSKFGKAFGTARGVAGTVFSGSEAFEEGAQFVIQEGTKDYYNKKYGGEGASFLDSLYKGASELNTKEGMESILLGGLSGGIQQSYGNLTQKGITGTGGKQGTATEKLVGDLNSTNSMKWFSDMKDAAARGINIMQEQQAHIRQGDVLSTKDSEADLMHNYLAVRIKNGRYDLVKEDIAAFRQQSSTDQGLDKLKQDGYANEIDTIETFNARLTNFEKHADNLKTTFEALNLRYGGVFTPDGKRVYDEKVIDQMAYAVSKIADYDQRIPELSQELITKGIDVQGAISKTEGAENPFAQIQKLEADKVINVDQAADLKTALTDVLQMTKRRQAFLEEYNTIAKNPIGYQETPELPKGSEVKVSTDKQGDITLEIGEEYYAGAKQLETNEGGVIKKFAKFTILGETEDGKSVNIRDSKTGQLQTIPKDKLIDYKITKTSAADPNAQVYIDNTDNIFIYNIGKKDQNPKGTLEYENGSLFFKSLDGKFNRRITRDELLPGTNPKTGEKYDVAKIYTNAKFTAKTEEALNKPVTKEEINDKFSKRQEIVQELVNNSVKRIEEIKKSIEQKKKQIQDNEESINNLLTTKKGLTRKKVAKAALKTIEQLGKTKIVLQNEIIALQEEQIDLENSLPYFQDLQQNLGELSENTREAMEDIKKDIASIEELIDHTKEAIKNGNSLVNKISDILDNAYSLVKDYLKRLKEETILPADSLNEYQEGLEKYLGEVGAQQFIDNQGGFVPAIKALQAEISEFEDEVGISTQEDKLKELKASLKDLNEGLDDLIKEQIAKSKILEHFEAKAKEYEERIKMEAEARKNVELQAKFFNVQRDLQKFSGIPMLSPEGNTEEDVASTKKRESARKPSSILFVATTTPSALVRDSDIRHQQFLNTLDSFPNRANIKATYVTKNNEKALGLEGITDTFLGDYKDKVKEGEEPILRIYVETSPEGTFFVNEKGERVGKIGEQRNPLDIEYEKIDKAFSSNKDGYYQSPKTELNKKYSDFSSKGWKIHIQFKKGDEARVAKHLLSNGLYFKIQNGTSTWFNGMTNSGATLYIGSAKEAIKVANFLKNTLSNTIENNKNSMTGDIYGNSIYGGSGSDINFSNGIALRFDIQKTDQYKNDKKYSEYALSTGLGQGLTGLPYLRKYGDEVVELEKVFEKASAQENKKKALERLGDIYKESKVELEKDYGKDFLGAEDIINPKYNNTVTDLGNGEFQNVSKGTDQSKLVYAGMPSTVLEDSFGKRYAGTEEDAKAYQQQWENRRKELLAHTDVYELPEAFNISRGIPIKTKEKQYIIGNLVSEEQLKNGEPVLAVSTLGTIEHQGRSVNIPVGSVMVQNGSTLEYANNRNLTSKEVDAVYNVLKEFVKQANETKTFPAKLTTFLRGIMYFSSPYSKDEQGNYVRQQTPEGTDKPTARNQFYFYQGNLYMGEREFAVPFTSQSIEANEVLIKEFLSGAYNHVNNKYLTDPILSSQPFIEYTGNLEQKEWANYQTYLLSKEGRSPEEVPLSTQVRPIDPAIPNDRNFNNKYSYTAPVLIEKEPVVDVAPQSQEPKAQEAKPQEPKIQTQKGSDEVNPTQWEEAQAWLKEKIAREKAEEEAAKNPQSQATEDEDEEAPFITDDVIPIGRTSKVVSFEAIMTPEPAKTNLTAEEIFKKQQEDFLKNNPGFNPTDSQKREVVPGYNYAIADLRKEKAYLEENFPFAVKTIENLIAAGNGTFLFGAYMNAVIYLSEKMEEGTGYHEAFEGVFDVFLNNAEKKRIFKEFAGRKGSFVDRLTGKKVLYKEATLFQAKEQMAEEFRDFKLDDVLPSNIEQEHTGIIKFFEDLLKWLRSVLTGEIYSLNNLFNRMDSAYYKNVPFKNAPSPYLQARERIGEFDATQTDSVVRGVVSSVFQNLMEEGETRLINDLDFGGKVPQAVYDKIKQQLEYYYRTQGEKTAFAELKAEGMSDSDIYNKLVPISNSIFSNWDKIVKYSGELLKTFKILQESEEDKEGDDSEITREESYLFRGDFEFDGKKNAPASIKLLIATLQESIFAATTTVKPGEEGLKKVTAVRDSATRMQKMVDYASTFNRLLDDLNTLNTLEQKENKLKELSSQYPEYVRLINRLETVSPTMQDWFLRIKFYNTFSKQHPQALNTYMLADGTSSTGSADLDNTLKQLSNNWLNTIKAKSNFKNGKYIFDASPIPSTTDVLRFFASLGIKFSPEQVGNISKYEMASLRSTMSKFRHVFSGKAVDVSSIHKLGLKTALEDLFKVVLSSQNLATESVFQGLDGNFKQSFAQTNAISRMINDLNNAQTLEELFEESPYLNDEYSKDSWYFQNALYGGNKKLGFKLLIKYIQGIVNVDGQDNVPTEKLSKTKKLLQAINQNLNENYYLLIPADSKTEWMVGMKNPFLNLSEAALDRFYKYYETEQDLGLTGRIFETFGENLSKEQFSKKFKELVNKEVEEQFKELVDHNIIENVSGGNFKWTGIDGKYLENNNLKADKLTAKNVKDILEYRTVNFMFNNIEMHKLFFGDPKFYSDFKRFKSFLSPREQALYNSKKFDSAANQEYNTDLKVGDPGYQNYKEYLKTVTQEDVISIQNLPGYDKVKGTDAQAFTHPAAYKQMRIKTARWNSLNEEQIQFIHAEDRQLMSKDKLYKYTNEDLRKADEKLMAKGDPKVSRFSPLKPIVSGFDAQGPVLDKYSITMLSYRMVRGTNMAAQYQRMLDNEIDYTIYKSGRKVGGRAEDSIYNADGTPNTAPYSEKAIINVPFKWFGIQVETQGDKTSQTWGSQLGKLSTVNLMDGGVPIDVSMSFEQWNNLEEDDKIKASPIYDLISQEREIREAMIIDGYKRLLSAVGISKDGKVSKKKLLSLITDELSRRELNDNIKDALQLKEDGDFLIPLEALNNYEQIKNVIFSYIDKYISRPKVGGGSKIQTSGAGMEVAGKRIVAHTKDGKTTYTSTGLHFYTPEKPWCGIMIGNWFQKELRKIPALKNATDKEILDYINDSPDGKEILSGIGFRIPTQELNSVENFRIEAFLPDYLGDMVVVPEALTTKSGGDFDVDKLNTYLKNVYVDGDGVLKIVKYFEDKEYSDKFYNDEFYGILGGKVEKAEKIKEKTFNLQQVIGDLAYGSPTEKFKNKWSAIIEEIFSDELDGLVGQERVIAIEEALQQKLEVLGKKLSEYNDWEFQEALGKEFVQKMYKQSLENQYYKILDKLLSLEANFERLTTPNSSAELMGMRDRLVKIAPSEFSLGSFKSILSPIFMNNLRHMYAEGKGGVGIAASGQVQNAISQKTPVVILPSKKGSLKDRNERENLGNAIVMLPSNKLGEFTTISAMKDRVHRYISDKISQFINGFVDIANDPFLVQLGVTRNNAGMFLLLERVGVPTPVTVLFMNQPIIREYQKQLERKGMGYPYINDEIEEIRRQFPVKNEIPTVFPLKGTSEESQINHLTDYLEDQISDFYNGKLTTDQNEFQQFALSEYLKYAVMAQNLFRFSQATNYDTTKFTNPYIYVRKLVRTKDAKENNIFSSAEEVMNKTFVGTIAKTIGEATEKISNAFFKFLSSDIQPYVFPTMYKLAERKKMNDLEFTKVARKVEQSFISYLIQNTNGINNELHSLLIEESTSAAKELNQMKNTVEAMKDNPFPILSQFITQSVASPDASKTVRMIRTGTDVFTQNTLIAAMQELKANPKTSALYEKLVKTAFLQSGIAKTPISFLDIVPVEDFKKYVYPAIEGLYNKELLRGFQGTDTFFRNSWADRAVIPALKADLIPEGFNSKDAELIGFDDWDPFDDGDFFKGNMVIKQELNNPQLKALAAQKGSPNFRAFKVSEMSSQFSSDYGTVTVGEKGNKKIILLKKLYYPNSDVAPTFPYSEYFPDNKYAIYYQINPLGDGYQAQEHYDTLRPTVFKDTRALSIPVELTAREILSALQGEINVPLTNNVVSLQGMQTQLPFTEDLSKPEFSKLPSKSTIPTMTYAGIGSRETPKEILAKMTEVAKELEKKGYTLNTGKTFGNKEEGADKAFSDGTTKKNLFAPEQTGQRELKIAEEIHPNWKALTAKGPGGAKLMGRNTNQIFGEKLDTPVDFVLFYAEETSNPLRPKGGTGQAVEMARRKGIPTINMANADWREQLDKALNSNFEAFKNSLKRKGC